MLPSLLSLLFSFVISFCFLSFFTSFTSLLSVCYPPILLVSLSHLITSLPPLLSSFNISVPKSPTLTCLTSFPPLSSFFHHPPLHTVFFIYSTLSSSQSSSFLPFLSSSPPVFCSITRLPLFVSSSLSQDFLSTSPCVWQSEERSSTLVSSLILPWFAWNPPGVLGPGKSPHGCCSPCCELPIDRHKGSWMMLRGYCSCEQTAQQGPVSLKRFVNAAYMQITNVCCSQIHLHFPTGLSDADARLPRLISVFISEECLQHGGELLL